MIHYIKLYANIISRKFDFRTIDNRKSTIVIELAMIYHDLLELLCLRQQLTPNPEGALHCFLAENHVLRLGGADSHPDRFTLSCKPPQ